MKKSVFLTFALLILVTNFVFGQTKYEQLKSEVALLQKKFADDYTAKKSEEEKKIVLEQASEAITDILVNNIFPEWYGTGWDFNGVSQIPKKGDIACGYFVSTCLRDVGFKINRIKTAQQNPLNEAKTIACGEKVLTIAYDNIASLRGQLKTQAKGLYFIGLADFHVGFVYLSEEGEYFIHSDYTKDAVESQDFALAAPLEHTSKVYIASITHNKTLMLKWLTGGEIKTVTQ